MLKARQGFTLIELLIVVVIIGILAAVAIPKFSATREKAYFSAMKSDLKNLQTQQEIYYNRTDGSGNTNYTYSNDKTALEFSESSGVTVTIADVTNTGWSATATHRALASTQYCAVYVGGAASVAPATVPGVVTCTGE
jgi:prepilin-type N-terminal cleavage/methylation domain-containing protein